MATATKATKATKATTKVTRIDPAKDDYKVTTTPPEFNKRGGKPPTALRLRLEALEVGEWLNTEQPGEGNAVNNLRGMAQAISRAEATLGQRYTVRVAPDENESSGVVWVGRTA